MVDVDSKTLFNAAAAVVASVAVALFVTSVELGSSPLSEVAVLLAFLAGVFALTQRTADRQLTLFGYGVVVVSVVALLFEVVSAFRVDDTLTVLGLLVLSGLLFALRTLLDEDNRFVTGRQATYAFGAVAALAVAVVLLDVVTGGLTYELQPRGEVEVAGDRHAEARVGTVVVTNPSPLPQRVDVPRYEACTAGNWSAYRLSHEDGERPPPVRARLHVRDGYDDLVFGFGSRTYPAVLGLEAGNFAGETFPVERTESCPATETGPPYIAVYEASDDRFGRAV